MFTIISPTPSRVSYNTTDKYLLNKVDVNLNLLKQQLSEVKSSKLFHITQI